MKSILILGAVLLIGVASSPKQSSVPDQKSPKELVTDFWKLETSGARLTPDGLNQTNDFFIRPSRPDGLIHVISNSSAFSVDESARTQNWSEVYVGTDEVGQIDSALHFKTIPESKPNTPVLRGPIVRFTLVLTDTHWPVSSDGVVGKAIVGTPEWRIDCAENTRWITVKTAIAYVTRSSDKVTDPSVKRNAQAAIAALAKYKD